MHISNVCIAVSPPPGPRFLVAGTAWKVLRTLIPYESGLPDTNPYRSAPVPRALAAPRLPTNAEFFRNVDRRFPWSLPGCTVMGRRRTRLDAYGGMYTVVWV
jgi:hypothetical protein